MSLTEHTECIVDKVMDICKRPKFCALLFYLNVIEILQNLFISSLYQSVNYQLSLKKGKLEKVDCYEDCC